MLKTILNYLVYNLFFALILWKGIEGNKTAQSIFIVYHWLAVSLLCFACGFISKTTDIKYLKNNIEKGIVMTWLSSIVTIGFISTLVYYNWIWTAFAVLMEFSLAVSFKSNMKKRYEELTAA